MKKNILSILLFMVVWGLVSSMQAKAQEDINKLKDYIITKKTYFTTPLFEKVFPDTKFYLGRINWGYDIVYYDIDGQEQNVVNKMNTLIKKCQSNKYATIEEIIEAMVRLKFYSKDSSNYDIIITKENNKNTYWKEDTILYNYKIVIKNSVFPVSEYYLIKYDGINFINNWGSNGGKLFDFSDRSYIDQKINDVCVHINNYSDHIIENDGYIHFYKIVNTGQLEFLTTNLEETISSGDKIDIKITLHDKPTVVLEHQENIALTEDFKAKFYWSPTNSALTGICDVQINHKIGGVKTWTIAKWQQAPTNIIPMVFIPENMVMMNGGNGFPGTNGLYQCWIYYCNEFFSDHTFIPPINTALDYANCVTSAMSEVWQKEIIDWELADGLWPLDADNKYIVAINHSTLDDITISYHNTFTTASITDTKTAGTEQQKIGFSSLIKNFITGYSTETNLIRSAFSHEFFHGIHNSLIARNGVREDLNENSFIVEGVATFLQTVFLENEEMVYSSIPRLYNKSALNFIIHNTNLNLRALNRYDYCIFWRFLYENYKIGNIKDKLMIFKEICKNSQSEKNLSSVVSMLSTQLGGGLGHLNYPTFISAYQDFVKRVLFNNCNYNTWNPCPSNSFYYDVPATEQTYSGSTITVSNPTLESFGVKYYHYTFTTAGRVYLQFDCDPNNNGNHADYYVNVLVDKSSGLPANNPLTITASNGEGGIFVDVTNPNDKIWVIVLRTDTKTGQMENYTLSMGASNNALFDFSADKTVVTGGKGMITFTTSGSPIGYHWSFPGGNPSTSTSASPSVSYSTPGTYDVTLNDLTKTNYILVTSSNQNPNLNISAGYFPGYPYTKYDFYCSILEGNPPYNYHFDFGDGCTSSITNSYDDYVNVSHTYPASGVYYPSVTVYDNSYEYQTVNLEAIAVNDPNSQIHADFYFKPIDYGLGPRHFTSTTSGGAVPYWQYDWTFGEDPVTHLSPVCPGGYNWASYTNWNHAQNFNGNPTFDPNYTNYGTFPVTLTVTDYNGFPSTITKTVTISEPVKCRPVMIAFARTRIGMNSGMYVEPFLLNPQCSGCYDWTSTDCCHSLPFGSYTGNDYCNQNTANWSLFKKNVSLLHLIDFENKTTETGIMSALHYSHYYSIEGTYILQLRMSDSHQDCRPAGSRTCDYTTSISFEVVDCDKITTICSEPQLPEKLDVGGDILIGYNNSCNNYTLESNKDYFYAATKSIYIGKGYFSPGTGKKFYAQLKDCYIITDLFNKNNENTDSTRNTNVTLLEETNTNNKTESFDINTLKMEVIPNPSEGKFVVSINGIMDTDFFNEYHVDLKIYSMIGSLVYNNKLIKEEKTNVDFTQQLPGIYMVKLMINDKIFTQKMIIQ